MTNLENSSILTPYYRRRKLRAERNRAAAPLRLLRAFLSYSVVAVLSISPSFFKGDPGQVSPLDRCAEDPRQCVCITDLSTLPQVTLRGPELNPELH